MFHNEERLAFHHLRIRLLFAFYSILIRLLESIEFFQSKPTGRNIYEKGVVLPWISPLPQRAHTTPIHPSAPAFNLRTCPQIVVSSDNARRNPAGSRPWFCF